MLCCTTGCNQVDGVVHIDVRGIEPQRTITVTWKKDIRGCTVYTCPCTCLFSSCTTGSTTIIKRTLVLTAGTCHTHLEKSSFSDVEVQITTHIDTIVTISVIITTSCFELTEQVTLMYIVNGSKIFYELSTTTNIHVSIVRHGKIFEQCILPINIRIPFTLFHSSLITEIINKIL